MRCRQPFRLLQHVIASVAGPGAFPAARSLSLSALVVLINLPIGLRVGHPQRTLAACWCRAGNRRIDCFRHL